MMKWDRFEEDWADELFAAQARRNKPAVRQVE
jgi:hypothetical protein